MVKPNCLEPTRRLICVELDPDEGRQLVDAAGVADDLRELGYLHVFVLEHLGVDRVRVDQN